jgi:hypothetical protein
MPIETTIMVAIPELDGATGTMVFGGRTENATGTQPCVCARNLGTCPTGRSCMSAHPKGSKCWPDGSKSWWPCAERTRQPQGCADDFQLPSECRQHGHGSLSFSV